MALGGDTKGSLAEVWNGRSWRVTLGPPGGASQVSCTSVRFCMTIGLSNDISPDGDDGCVTAAVWRGTAWHTVAMPY